MMLVGLFDDAHPGTHFVDFFGLGDSGDVVSHIAAFRRLIRATLSYYAVRA